MEEVQKTFRMFQWHPAFYACTRIEFSGETEEFRFCNEYQLGTKPMEIDVLIIKKDPNAKIQKNIGRIFRTHNILEYKSPVDHLGIDDYYKVCGYACFYKADAQGEDAISASEITISFVSHHHPYKLIRYLEEERHLCVERQEAGVYYIKGDIFPMQLIVTSRLSPEKNLWLSSLTDNLQQGEHMERLVQEYGKHSDDTLYRSAMDLIVRANRERFEEGKEMCEALMELFEDDIEAARREGRQEGRQEGRKEGLLEGILAMIADNLEEGFSSGKIMQKLEKRFALTPQEAREYLEKYGS
ncbi:MAG: 3-isopropylmalate dehydrogenase [Lachnospiraceae bacterium]|nr:3-isopropylmalate dehydrogenase [Butyrivibrio sp.]MCM1342768.1 hypothetical protein [Muribaculaceae bacterium]MCM1409968.1 3-isopropylmalate dehydrogenase [Lachnospiraceae bacterium]